jgi:hypothetical protein
MLGARPVPGVIGASPNVSLNPHVASKHSLGKHLPRPLRGKLRILIVNIRRGFYRIVLVLGICYFVFGVLWISNDWEHKKSNREFEFERCMKAVRDPGTGNVFPLVKETDCLKSYPPVNERSEIFAFFAIPTLFYWIWKVLVWVGRGFQGKQHISN